MADGLNGNGSARMEAIAKNVQLAAINRIAVPLAIAALVGISGWGASILKDMVKALGDQNATLAAQAATIVSIEKRLDRIDVSADSAAQVAAGLQKQIDDNHTEARTAAADLQAKLDVVNGRLAPMWDAVARIQAAILSGHGGKQ